jgi:hypothetical protein
MSSTQIHADKNTVYKKNLKHMKINFFNCFDNLDIVQSQQVSSIIIPPL